MKTNSLDASGSTPGSFSVIEGKHRMCVVEVIRGETKLRWHLPRTKGDFAKLRAHKSQNVETAKVTLQRLRISLPRKIVTPPVVYQPTLRLVLPPKPKQLRTPTP